MNLLAEDPILVLGAPRSGTTYLRTILDCHPEVVLTNEVRLFGWLHRAIAATNEELAVFEQREPFTAHLRQELPDVLRRYYRQLDRGARWWGDKNPHYAESETTLRTTTDLFPGTRFVHIVRDPRAVVASLMRKQHADGRPWIGAEDAHVQVVNHVLTASRFGRSQDPEHYLELRYEDLVADDVGVARRLFAWLDIPFAAEVEQFCRQQAIERSPISGPTSDLASAGNHSAAIAAWAAVVPLADQRRSLQFLTPILLQFGYETPASLDAENRRLPPDVA